MTFKAYEFLCKVRAGLQLCGIEDGQLQWMGTREQWRRAEVLEMDYIWK